MSADLLARLDAFDIDGKPVALPFAARLAREQGWSRAFAERAVREYKRFAYLAVTGGRPVCPSEEIDAVWHLHLTYTRSYWGRFCGELLGRQLHHDPTAGGPAEAAKHRAMYADTFAAYRAAFGEEPPADLWPEADTRFAPPATPSDFYAVRKSTVRRGLVAAAVLLSLGCAVPNPFDATGPEFLLFFLPALAVAFGMGLLIRASGKGSRTFEPAELGWERAAYLIGEGDRLLSATVARLVDSGAAKVSADGKSIERAGSPPTNPVEAAVYQSLPLGKSDARARKQARTAATLAVQPILRQMEADGLKVPDAVGWRVGRLSALPLALVIGLLGLPRLAQGVASHQPIFFLAVALVIGSVTALVMWAGWPRRTRRGDHAVAAVRRQYAPLQTGGDGDAGLAVALFGTAALSGAANASLQGWYPKKSGADSGCGSGCMTGSGGSGCSSGGGDSGGSGCGSGCGGCGGGGGD